MVKYHLYRPDEKGQCALIVACRDVPLELVQLCLPDYQYLTDNPSYLDELLKNARLNHQVKPELLSFLSDREAIKCCPQRDAYFKEWVDFEMHAAGAEKGEWYEDFVSRKKPSGAELLLLVSKFPLEARRVFSNNPFGQFGTSCSLNGFLFHQGRDLERALIVLKYSFSKPTYFTNFNNEKLGQRGSFELLLEHCSGISGERNNYLFAELWKRTIPSEEYRKSHSNEAGNLYVSWV